MQRAYKVFEDFLKNKGLKLTTQRMEVLEVFIEVEGHLSVDEFFIKIKSRYPNIGHTTVFRTLKLLVAAQIAREINLMDKVVRYEHKYAHDHHDHLVCTRCGLLIEVADEKLEKRKEELCKSKGFMPTSHKLKIIGFCKDCVKTK